jgi:pyruvate kinase
MNSQVEIMQSGEPENWDTEECRSLISELWQLRESLLAHAAAIQSSIDGVASSRRASACNLAHYLALRFSDHRPLQERLARIGVSSLGRSESHVLANLDKVLGILHRLAGRPWQPHSADEPVGIRSSRRLLEIRAAELLGAPPPNRRVRIMVTLPAEAAADFGLVRQLVLSGMDIARINCAHDGPPAWVAMAAHVRRAAKAARRPVRILMDLGGPKLRTGQLPHGPAVLKLRPARDELGRVSATARLGLRPAGSAMPVAGAAVHVGVDADWLAQLGPGDHIDLVDARGADRSLLVAWCDGESALVECGQTAYLIPGTKLKRRRHGPGTRSTQCADLPAVPGVLSLQRGDMLRVMRSADGCDSNLNEGGGRHQMLSVPCTLPEIFAQVAVGERIWFDDGRIGGVIRHVEADWLDVEITMARASGEKLAGDKGINLPDSQLDLPALTGKDLEDLAVVAREADMVGLSFAQSAADVASLREHLQQLGRADMGVVLKIETRRGFENLPDLLFASMACNAAGVMIARGDLAVECGYERLAEVQEEILWAAEAAHMPVIWATQVLETLAKTGLPSRAEITDAAMGERAECVMLNKGPHIVDAMHTLDDILRRMQDHQTKKRPLLRALNAWAPVSRKPRGPEQIS